MAVLFSGFEFGIPIPRIEIFVETTLRPERIIYSPPATIVFWNDGSKTVVKCMEGDEFSELTGFALALAKKMYGSHMSGSFRKLVESKVTRVQQQKQLDALKDDVLDSPPEAPEKTT